MSRLVCPKCAHHFSSGVFDVHAGKGLIPTPEPGGLLVCQGCRGVLIYEEPIGSGLRLMTMVELAKLPAAERQALASVAFLLDRSDRAHARRKGKSN